MKPRVAVVILNWNGRGYLAQFLPSIIASTYENFFVVLADNASTDDSIGFVKANFPTVHIIQLSENFGFARGYNEALKQVSSDYYVLLNSDVEVQAGWLSPVIDLMESNPNVAVAQPKILTYANKNVFEYAGAAGGWLDYLGYPFARGRVFDYCETDEGQYNDPQQVFWAGGAAMFVKSNVFHEVGGLDPYFFAHQEEIDFCWRVQLAGYTVMVCPASVVYHVGGGTLPKGNSLKVYLNFRNNLIMLTKNESTAAALWKIPLRFLLDSISAWKSLFEGESKYFKAVGKAHFAYLKWLIGGRNKTVMPKTKKGKVHGWCTRSIVWQHFVKGKKSFLEIVGTKSLKI